METVILIFIGHMFIFTIAAFWVSGAVALGAGLTTVDRALRGEKQDRWGPLNIFQVFLVAVAATGFFYLLMEVFFRALHALS